MTVFQIELRSIALSAPPILISLKAIQMKKVACALVALCLTAGAAQAHTSSVIIVGDLQSPAGKMKFDRDVRTASLRLCRGLTPAQQPGCRSEIMAEAVNQLSDDDRAAFTRWQQSRQAR